MLRQEGSRKVQEPKGSRIAFGQKMSRREQVAHRGLGVPRIGLEGPWMGQGRLRRKQSGPWSLTVEADLQLHLQS